MVCGMRKEKQEDEEKKEKEKEKLSFQRASRVTRCGSNALLLKCCK